VLTTLRKIPKFGHPSYPWEDGVSIRIAVLFGVAGAVLTSQFVSPPASESVLGRQSMEVTFGGQSPQVPYCKGVNAACQSLNKTCAQLPLQACAQGATGTYIYSTYGFKCNSDASNPANSCTSYPTDANGIFYPCLEDHRCRLMLNVCTDSGVVTFTTYGWYSVASNCGT
jgi:hypothetical protein